MKKYLLVIEVDRVGADGRYITTKNQVVEGNPYKWFEQFKAEHDYESVNSWLKHTLINWLKMPEAGGE